MAKRPRTNPHPSTKLDELPELLDKPQILALLGIGTSTLWRIEKEDPNFPRSFSFAGRNKRWKKKAVAKWLDDKHAEANAEVA